MTFRDNSHTIIVERGPRLGEYQGAEILDWFITADGRRHTFLRICALKDFFMTCINEDKTLLELTASEITKDRLSITTQKYALLSPGLLYENEPV